MKTGVEKRFFFFSMFIILVFVFLFLVFFTDFSITGHEVKGSSISYTDNPYVRVVFTFLVIVATLGVSFLLFKEINKITKF